MRLKHRLMILLHVYVWATFILLMFGTFLPYLLLVPIVIWCFKGGIRHA